MPDDNIQLPPGATLLGSADALAKPPAPIPEGLQLPPGATLVSEGTPSPVIPPPVEEPKPYEPEPFYGAEASAPAGEPGARISTAEKIAGGIIAAPVLLGAGWGPVAAAATVGGLTALAETPTFAGAVKGMTLGAAEQYLGGKVGEYIFAPLARTALMRVARTLPAQYKYGADPLKALAKDIEISKDMPSLINKTREKLNVAGKAIDTTADAIGLYKPVNMGGVLRTLGDEIDKARKVGADALADRVESLRATWIKNFNLQNATLEDAISFKRALSDVTRFKGEPLAESLENVMRKTYGKARMAIESVAPELKPLNEHYGSLIEGLKGIERAHGLMMANPVTVLDWLGGMAGAGAAIGGQSEAGALTLGAIAAKKIIMETAPGATTLATLLKRAPQILPAVLRMAFPGDATHAFVDDNGEISYPTP